MSTGEKVGIATAVVTLAAIGGAVLASHLDAEAGTPAPVDPQQPEQTGAAGHTEVPVDQPVKPDPPYAQPAVQQESWGIVPSLVGLTVGAARTALAHNGLEIGIERTGGSSRSPSRVATQSIAPLEHVPLHSVVGVTLESAPATVHSIVTATHTHPAAIRTVPAKPLDGTQTTITNEPPPLPPLAPSPVIEPVGSEVPGSQLSGPVVNRNGESTPISWTTIALVVAAVLALAGAVYKLLRRVLLPPLPAYRILMRSDIGEQSCLMPSRPAFLPAVDVRLASQAWDACVSSMSGKRGK